MTLTTVRYVMDSNGKRTDVLIPLATWETLLATRKQLIELLEDQEDNAILQEWLEKRAAEVGLNGFVDQVADETVATTAEELVEFLTKVDHPALKMDSIL